MSDEALRVLYVEDDPDIQEIAHLALEDLGGMSLVVCSSGAEALNPFQRLVRNWPFWMS